MGLRSHGLIFDINIKFSTRKALVEAEVGRMYIHGYHIVRFGWKCSTRIYLLRH